MIEDTSRAGSMGSHIGSTIPRQGNAAPQPPALALASDTAVSRVRTSGSGITPLQDADRAGALAPSKAQVDEMAVARAVLEDVRRFVETAPPDITAHVIDYLGRQIFHLLRDPRFSTALRKVPGFDDLVSALRKHSNQHEALRQQLDARDIRPDALAPQQLERLQQRLDHSAAYSEHTSDLCFGICVSVLCLSFPVTMIAAFAPKAEAGDPVARDIMWGDVGVLCAVIACSLCCLWAWCRNSDEIRSTQARDMLRADLGDIEARAGADLEAAVRDFVEKRQAAQRREESARGASRAVEMAPPLKIVVEPAVPQAPADPDQLD